MANILNHLPELDSDEMVFVQGILQHMTDEQAQQYASIYRARRKDSQVILITCLLGFVCFAGVHRFVLGHMGMGILYFFTAGFCLVGTIVDLINYKRLAFEYNVKEAQFVYALMNPGGMQPPYQV